MIWVWLVALTCYIASLALLRGAERVWAAIILGAALFIASIFLIQGPR